MEKDIRFTGYSAVPSDYDCSDGELTQAYNLINEEGTMRPVLEPKVVLDIPGGYDVIFIHKSNSFDGDHFIIRKEEDGSLYWVQKGKTWLDNVLIGGWDGPRLTFPDLDHIDAVGNTLLVFTADAIHYLLWKDGAYNHLGDHLPNVELSFGLRGTPLLWSYVKGENGESRGKFDLGIERIKKTEWGQKLSDENKRRVTLAIMANVNKFLAEETIQKGRFALPFFVRYALRLYDGSLVCHSAPILMNPATNASPIVFTQITDLDDTYYNKVSGDIMLVSSKLDYKVIANEDAESLANWSDLITGIDVFISKPIYMHDQNGEIESLSASGAMAGNRFIGALDFDGFYEEDLQNKYNVKLHKIKIPATLKVGQDATVTLTTSSPAGKESPLGKISAEWHYDELFQLFFYRTDTPSGIQMPVFDAKKNEENLARVQNFYFLHSIKLEDIDLESDERTDIPIADDYLQSLTTREPMTDDYLTHDRLTASNSQNYNARINLSGIRRELFKGFSASSLLCNCEKLCANHIQWTSSDMMRDRFDVILTDSPYNSIRVFVYIKENGVEYCVGADNSTSIAPFFNGVATSWGCYVFYPNVNATKMVVLQTKETVIPSVGENPSIINYALSKYEIPLKAHDFLNGAYGILEYGAVRNGTNVNDNIGVGIGYNIAPKVSDSVFVAVPNKLYTSEINNPFYFPLTGINTIGTGRILGISTAAKALSQGQFGQFPLYAFTDEGVWALEVSSSGSFQAKQPITRDVCIAPESITQIDSAVLFATDRGIMMISGSQTECITDVLNAPDYFDLHDLPHLDTLYPDGIPHIDCTFADYRQEARMAYDYINQRIIVFRPNFDYAYVYSLRSKLWGIMAARFTAALNSYPDSYVMAKGVSKGYSYTNKNGKDVYVDKEMSCLLDLSHSASTSAKGLLVTRPIKLEEASMYKTIDTVFFRGFFPPNLRKVQCILYGSRDCVNWHLVHSAREHYLRGFRGTPYKYYRLVAITDLNAGETLTGASVQYTPRLTNQLR